MTDKLKEAIEVLKKFKEWANTPINGSSKYDLIKLFGSIDTVVAEVEKPTYTADDMEAFAEFLIGRNTEWITKLQRNETAKTLIELWEKEMRKKED